MSKKITLSDDETSATVAEATLLDPITNILNPKVTFTGMAKYTVPVLSAAGAALFMNKRHAGSYFDFGQGASI